MNKTILLVIVIAFTVATYLVMYYLIGWDQKRSLIVTGVAFLAMVLPEIIAMARGRRERMID